MEKVDAAGKGTVVLATVRGDVHDIGKNLVDIILTNNGYMVYNLGIKIAITEMIDKALEVDADAIGMSGLLVKSDDHHAREPRGAERRAGSPRRCRCCSAAPRSRATTSRSTCARRLRRSRLLRQGRVRGSAHDGHVDGGQEARRRSIPRSAAKPAAASCRPARASSTRRAPVEIPDRSDVATDVPVFTPPFVGSRVAKGISLDDIAALHQRDRAVPQPVAVPPREGRRTRTTTSSRRASGRRCASSSTSPAGRPAGARGRVGLLRGEQRRQRPRRLEGRHPHAGVAAVLVPAPAQGAVPLHRRLLPACEHRASPTTRRSTS